MVAHVSDLVTLVVAKVYLGSPDGDDNYVKGLISGASMAIERYCSRLLKARVLTEVYDGDGTAELILHQYPVNIITSVHQDSTRAFATASLVPAGYYLLGQDKRVLFGISVYWISGLQTIQIVYNAGYGLVTEMTIILATFLATGTITINGLIFTAHATTTTPANREFSISGDDTADAVALCTCINDAIYGVSGVTASSALGVVTLASTDPNKTLITAFSNPDDKTCVKAITQEKEIVPKDLQTAALILIDFWYKSFSDHRFGVSGVSIGDKSISYETDLPKQVKTLLSSYRNKVIY